MQIGHGKEGVIIGEYELRRANIATKGEPEKIDTNPILGWIEPACDNPQWILWFMADGSAVLYQDRAKDGGVEGEPLKIKSRN